MSNFKTQSRLLGLPVDGDSDDDEEEPEERGEEEPEDASEEEEEDDEEDEESDEAVEEPGGTSAGTTTAEDRAAARKKDRKWMQDNFIKMIKNEGGKTVYKSDILPDKVFFSKETLREFTEGRRYKRLIHEMRKGMRTHADNEKLRVKAEARRERQNERRQQKRQEKVQQRRHVDPGDTDEIARRKALFQEKKARRLERKAAAAAAL